MDKRFCTFNEGVNTRLFELGFQEGDVLLISNKLFEGFDILVPHGTHKLHNPWRGTDRIRFGFST